ncbi:metallophosphoesterase family protein [Rosistilla ulvae]|uniref:metallophosphoesterase family protein n=1 Tax=Rosistilla ulvae TaxID=1930277 RepID=UPI001FECF386|nr:metallophosphoesterase family protein [Rosistilla ulvae]
MIAIGDIHGCSDALQALLDSIAPTPQDTLVVLGDVVDRGEGTRQAVELLLEVSQQTQLITILGNHEEMMLRVLDGEPPQRWLQFGGIDTLDSYGFTGDFSAIPESHHAFFDAMRDYYETDDYFFTHAAYKHDLPLDYQPADLLRWHSLKEGLPPAHENGKICFVGHTAHKEGEIMDFGHLVCLDTYCYGGGWLTAMDVRTRQTWQADISGQLRDR